MSHASKRAETMPADAPRPRFAYPEPLTQEDRNAMDRLLPDRPTEAILLWIAGEGPDPWGESSD